MSKSELKVKLISHSEDPDKVVTMAAKLCYSPVGVEEIGSNLTDEQIEKFLNMLVGIGHESPVEHTSFTFAIEGISRACSHQLVRHRIASYSQQSQRYVRLDNMEYIVPPAIEAIPAAKVIYIEAMEQAQEKYSKLVDQLIASGKNEKEAIEDARYIFPNACETKIVVTMNARSLFNFFSKRCCERAQWEIKELAYEMLKECKRVAPILFRNCGPSCYKGSCKEGKLSCRRPDIPKRRIDAMNE
ncbi:MAG: FAD-dependent thymidylate synthase [Peptostreptococcaceae bacterium]|nr:FAD-dependent thymidylate synthase [Peptostreptococcaceae bacterium]